MDWTVAYDEVISEAFRTRVGDAMEATRQSWLQKPHQETGNIPGLLPLVRNARMASGMGVAWRRSRQGFRRRGACPGKTPEETAYRNGVSTSQVTKEKKYVGIQPDTTTEGMVFGQSREYQDQAIRIPTGTGFW